jgi:alpha-L-fucosidase
VESLLEFKRLRDGVFAHDLAKEATTTASNTRGGGRRFSPNKVKDGKRDTYWATDDGAATPELVLAWARPVTFSVIRLCEYLPLGQRVEAFGIDQWVNDKWFEIATGTSIGNCRLVRVQPTTTSKIRLRIVQAPVCPAISDVGVFAEKP